MPCTTAAIEGAAVAAVEQRVDARRITRGQETQRSQPVALARADEAVAEVEHGRQPAAVVQQVEGRVLAGQDHVRALRHRALQEGIQLRQQVRRQAGRELLAEDAGGDERPPAVGIAQPVGVSAGVGRERRGRRAGERARQLNNAPARRSCTTVQGRLPRRGARQPPVHAHEGVRCSGTVVPQDLGQHVGCACG